MHEEHRRSAPVPERAGRAHRRLPRSRIRHFRTVGGRRQGSLGSGDCVSVSSAALAGLPSAGRSPGPWAREHVSDDHGCNRMGQAMPAVTSLFGREPETRVLGDLLDHVPGRGGSLVLSGEPGIGKSALLREASTRAQQSGMLVLTATGVQSEAQLPFAGLHQLLRPVLGQLDGLAAPQRNAILAAFGLADGLAPDLFLTALASAGSAGRERGASPGRWSSRRMRTGSTGPPARCWRSWRGGWSSSRSCWSRRSATASRARFTDAGLPALHLEALPAAAAAALLDSRAPGLPLRCATGCSTRRRATRSRWWNCRLPSAISAAERGCPGGCRSRRAWSAPSRHRVARPSRPDPHRAAGGRPRRRAAGSARCSRRRPLLDGRRTDGRCAGPGRRRAAGRARRSGVPVPSPADAHGDPSGGERRRSGTLRTPRWRMSWPASPSAAYGTGRRR